MKKINLNIKAESLVTVGLAALGVAQMLLTNKKDASSRNTMKAEILEELKNELQSK